MHVSRQVRSLSVRSPAPSRACEDLRARGAGEGVAAVVPISAATLRESGLELLSSSVQGLTSLICSQEGGSREAVGLLAVLLEVLKYLKARMLRWIPATGEQTTKSFMSFSTMTSKRYDDNESCHLMNRTTSNAANTHRLFKQQLSSYKVCTVDRGLQKFSILAQVTLLPNAAAQAL